MTEQERRQLLIAAHAAKREARIEKRHQTLLAAQKTTKRSEKREVKQGSKEARELRKQRLRATNAAKDEARKARHARIAQLFSELQAKVET